MSKHRHGFIINARGSVILWVTKDNTTIDGFYFEVINGNWRGRWADTDDCLTNGVFKVAGRGCRNWQQATFRYEPPAMPAFDMTDYNAAIDWMQRHIDGGN